MNQENLPPNTLLLFAQISDVYPQHRRLIIEEVVTLLWKLPSSKRSLRSYHLSDEEPKQIQILTALILQLVQCSVTLPEVGAVSKTEVERNGENGENTFQKVFEPAMEFTSHFWKNVFQRLAAPKNPDGADVKGIVDNLLMDLLTTLNVPEFPAASLLLQVVKHMISESFYFRLLLRCICSERTCI